MQRREGQFILAHVPTDGHGSDGEYLWVVYTPVPAFQSLVMLWFSYAECVSGAVS